MENVIGVCVIGFMIMGFILICLLQNISFLHRDVKDVYKLNCKMEMEILSLKYDVKRLQK